MSERMALIQMTVRIEIPDTWTPGRRCEVVEGALSKIASLTRNGAESGTIIIANHGAIGTWFMTQEPIDDDVAVRLRGCDHDRGRAAIDRDRLGCGDKSASDDGPPRGDGDVAH